MKMLTPTKPKGTVRSPGPARLRYITVTLVAVDHKGKQIDKLGIDFESMSLGTPEP